MSSQNHSHGHGHSQGHSHGHGSSGSRLIWVTLLNFTITAAEFVGGFLSNSLALLSDAVHNLGDTIAIIFAYVAERIGRRSANERRTFGYKRIEILAALFNSFALIIITIFLFKEAWERFLDPKPVKGLIMFVVATIGLLANLFSVLFLHKQSKDSLNIKAAYLHLLGDTISSVAVIIGSVLIYFFGIYWIDPLITVVIGLYILKEAYQVSREAVDILMQTTPKNIDLTKVQQLLETNPEVKNIHHVHVWELGDGQIHFECHADLQEDINVSGTAPLLEQMEKQLKNNFGISHVTIQFGYRCCGDHRLIHEMKHR